MSRKRIFIIDNDSDFLGELAEMLTLSGYTAEKRYICKKTLREIKSSKPDIVILDLYLDNGVSYEFAVNIRKELGTDQVPIIVLTACGLKREHFNMLEEAGVNDAIEKPFRPLDIISSIENLSDIELKETSTDVTNSEN